MSAENQQGRLEEGKKLLYFVVCPSHQFAPILRVFEEADDEKAIERYKKYLQIKDELTNLRKSTILYRVEPIHNNENYEGSPGLENQFNKNI